MPRAQWPLRHYRPCIRIFLTRLVGGQRVARYLLADTGALSARFPCDFLLEKQDCLTCGYWVGTVTLGRAYAGPASTYLVRVQIPELDFDEDVVAAGVSNAPQGFQGNAAFRFLNRFTYGNFGDPGQFGLET
jgi:hypothetical protein